MNPAATLLFLLSLLALAQERVRVEYACPDTDVESFGLTCSEQEPCPVFLELSSVEAVGARIFLAGNLHTSSTTLYGILLASDDGAKSWTEPHPRLRASVLEQIQFLDFEHGWVSGEHLEPLPKDPFLLLTTDGGKTWTKRPLFEESRFGSIAQFWFDSPTSGELVIDRSQGQTTRQELYASMTGGESWEIKETRSTAIRLSKARSKENAAWRVQADAASKTYRVERRGAEKWETVSSFIIHIGECK